MCAFNQGGSVFCHIQDLTLSVPGPPTDANVAYMTAKHTLNDPSGVSLRILDSTIGVVQKCMTGTVSALRRSPLLCPSLTGRDRSTD